MCELRKLDEDTEDANLKECRPFRFDVGNHKFVEYISVPSASTAISFKASLRKQKRDNGTDFISRIVARVGEKVKTEGDEKTRNSIAAEWVVEALMFLLLEGLIHYMKLPNEVVTEKDKTDLERFIKLTMKMWRALNLSVTVKAHVVESHLLSQIEMYKGLGDFVEEFIELLHQDTKRFRRRMGHLPDFEQQSSAMIFWNRLENLASVQDEQEKVLSGSKLKRHLATVYLLSLNGTERTIANHYLLAQLSNLADTVDLIIV